MTWDGPLNLKSMPPEVKRAYTSYKAQRQRCYNKNNDSYRYYGAKGVEVKYTSRDFITWWLKEQEMLKLKRPTCGRINHSGNYEFGNIRLEEYNENCGQQYREVRIVIKIIANGMDLSKKEIISLFDQVFPALQDP